MSNAEQYIQEHTRNAVNHITEKFPWISVCDAQKAVEIAREEICEWLSYHLDTSKMDVDYKFEVIEELRKAMKDE